MFRPVSAKPGATTWPGSAPWVGRPMLTAMLSRLGSIKVHHHHRLAMIDSAQALCDQLHSGVHQRSRGPVRWSLPAVLLTGWSVAFAGLSAYWAAGGTAMLEGLSPTIQHLAATRPPSFIALVWASVALKLAYAFIAVATRTHLRTARSRKLLLMAGYALGAGTITYAAAEAALAVIIPQVPTIWYLLLWGPLWAIGGLLVLAVTHEYRHRSRTCPRP